jgi:glutamate dehydrogenase (NAD(P)+)
VSTGKHINQGGIRGRTESTGLGVYYGIRELLNTESFYDLAKLSKGIKNKTFVVQGFGNVGYWASKFISEDGGIITTVVEHDAAIHNSKGFNVDDLNDYKIKNGTIKGYKDCQEEITENPA